MPWCPKCKAEYIIGFTKCRDCGMELIEKLPDIVSSDDSDDSAKEQVGLPCNEHVEEVLLITTDDLAQFSYITSMLKNEGSIYWVMEQNIGQYTQIVYGLNLYGKSIYVAEYDYERAKEILKSYVPSEVPNEAFDIPEDDSADDVIKTFHFRRNLALKLLRLAFYISFLIYLILGALKN
jgi:hypothetical protein